MDYLLLLCATMASAVKGLVCKKIGGSTGGNRQVFELNALIFLGAAVTVAAYAWLSGIGFHASSLTVILSVLFAAMLLFTQLTQTFAMRYGPASITSLIYSLGFLLPIFYSALFLGEQISVLQICGILVAICSLCFMIDLKCDRKIGRLWLLFCFLACSGSGTNAIIQKIHRSRTLPEEIPCFLVLTFCMAMVFSWLVSLLAERGQQHNGEAGETVCRREPIPVPTLLFNLLFSGTVIGALNILNLVIAGKLPAIIQFPVFNIGSMILVGLGGKFLFHDKLTRRQTIGFVIGCGAILMIGLL